MNKSETKKIVALILGFAILFGAVFLGYEYVSEPKMLNGVTSKNIDSKGKPVDKTTTFSPEDTVYFSAKQNRFWIKKAQIVWYKGEIKKENRIYVEKKVKVNKGGYFTGELTVPEGLEEGQYGVTIYVDGAEIMESKAKFNVKK